VPDIRIHRDSQTWAEAAAEFVLEVGKEAIRANGRFFIALSGGTTPETLTKPWPLPPSPIASIGPEPHFFSDERCVPPDDPRSNYALANKALFTPLRITPSQVYRMAGGSSDPQAAAYEYEQ
jgi:6-phosphogluconolactonase